MDVIKEIRLTRWVLDGSRKKPNSQLPCPVIHYFSSEKAAALASRDPAIVDQALKIQIYKQTAIGVARMPGYGKTLDCIEAMKAAILADYPDTNPAQIRVTHYGGSRYKGTIGLEFDIAEDQHSPLPGWVPINELEQTK